MLFADFVVPLRKMVVEVHGIQHYEWKVHFHSTKRDFLRAKQRDKDKQTWCSLNGLFYIELPHWENVLEWRKRIINMGESEG
jgi:hypothetical protein